VIFCQLEKESSPTNADRSRQPSTREMIIFYALSMAELQIMIIDSF
jgi:hypothetical protein